MPWDRRLPPAAQLPCGLAGMVNHENRLLSEPTELLTAEGVTFEDIHVRKEGGASLYDSGALTFISQFDGTFDGFSGTVTANDIVWFGLLATFQVSAQTTQFQKAWSTTGTATSPATGITLTMTVPAGGVPAGRLLVVAMSMNEDDTGASVAISDSGGNTYTLLHQSSLKEFNVWFLRMGAAGLNAGDAVTVTITGLDTSDQPVQAVGAVAEFGPAIALSPLDQTVATGSQTGAAVNIGPTSPVAAAPNGSTAILSVAVTASFHEPGKHNLTPGANYIKHIEAGTTAATLDVDDRTLNILSRVDSNVPRIVAIHDWYSDVRRTPTGGSTIAIEAGSTTVNRVAGDTFASLAPGDRLEALGQVRIIATVPSTTQLTVTEAFDISNPAATYTTRPGNRIITATSAGNLFKEVPTSLTAGNVDGDPLRGGLATEAPGRFIQGGKEAAANNRKLFYFNGADPVQVLSGDGSVTTNITTPPLDWGTVQDPGKQPLSGTIHAESLAAWGNLSDPHRVYFSDPDDHENFTSAAAYNLRFRSEIGDRIYAGISFQGVFFVWKYPRGIFYLDDTDLDPANWLIRTKTEVIGCAPSQYAALALDDDVLFMDPNGHFHLLSAVDALGGTRASDLTLRLGQQKWTRDNVNLKELRWTRSYWYPEKKLAVFYVPPTGSRRPSLALKWDFAGIERGLPVRFSFSQRDTGDAVATRRTSDGSAEKPILAEDTSVFLLDQTARNKNGAGYVGTYQLPHTDLAHIDSSLRWRRKLFEHLELLMEPVAAGTLTVEVYVDGSLKQTLTFDATKRRQKKKLNVGDGYTISPKVTNSVANEDFKVLSHIVWFKVGNEDKER